MKTEWWILGGAAAAGIAWLLWRNYGSLVTGPKYAPTGLFAPQPYPGYETPAQAAARVAAGDYTIR